MNKSFASIVVAGSLSLASQSVLAEGWEFFPVTNDDYQFEPQLSVIGGNMDAGNGIDGTMTGVELAINCPLLKAPNGVIRQQVSYATFDENGVEVTSFELNPHYQVNVAENLEFGFGPGFGYLTAEGGTLDDSAFTLQAGASLSYSIDQLVIGAEARYQFAMSDLEANGNKVDMDNSRLMLKVGYRF